MKHKQPLEILAEVMDIHPEPIIEDKKSESEATYAEIEKAMKIYAEQESKRSVAERLHDSYTVQEEVKDVIWNAFEKYESEVADSLDFSIGSDDYDNSIEIYIKNVIPYPYEPCWEIRDAVYALGFGTVYWNFADENGKFIEEIRGSEPRRYKPEEKRTPEMYDSEFCKEMWEKWKINGVDKRFNGDEWFKKYSRKK